MKYDLIPLNSKILLKRAILQKDDSKEQVGFYYEESIKLADAEY
jgi:hypothetical protein